MIAICRTCPSMTHHRFLLVGRFFTARVLAQMKTTAVSATPVRTLFPPVLFEGLSEHTSGATKRPMDSAESYRKRSAELRAMACFAETRAVAAEWRSLADWYARLAEQAEQNSKLDLSIEVGPPLRLGDDQRNARLNQDEEPHDAAAPSQVGKAPRE